MRRIGLFATARAKPVCLPNALIMIIAPGSKASEQVVEITQSAAARIVELRIVPVLTAVTKSTCWWEIRKTKISKKSSVGALKIKSVRTNESVLSNLLPMVHNAS